MNRRSDTSPTGARAPALLFYNALGDHLLTLPAIRALASLFPGELAFAGYDGMPQTFFPEVRFRAIVPLPAELSSPEVIAAALGRCDLLLCLNRSSSPTVGRLLQILGARESIGFFPEFRTRLPFRNDKHSVDQAFDVARFLDRGLRLADFSGPPVLPAESRTLADSIRSALPRNARLLAVHADTKPDKTWAAASFARLLDLFLARHPDFFALVVGARDVGLKTGPHARRIVSCIGVPLGVSMGLVGAADLFLGVDSSMLHAADLFRVPGVGLFGPRGNPHEFGFRFAPHRHLVAPAAIDAIGVADVLDALEEMLAHAAADAHVTRPDAAGRTADDLAREPDAEHDLSRSL
jgi:ADP-heptose:LPS heptosyltransferase